MAKSLRSKWRRKMRAEKRVRYGEKELQRLKDQLTKAGDYQMIEEAAAPDAIMEEKIPINALPRHPRRKNLRKNRDIPTSSSSSRKSRRDQLNDDDEDEDDEMKDDEEQPDPMSVDKPSRVYSKRTMKDQFGNYPVWMNKRKMMTQKKKNKRIARNRAASLARSKKSR